MGGRPLCLNSSFIAHFEDSRPPYLSVQQLLEEAGPDIHIIKFDAHIPEGVAALLDVCPDYVAKGYSINPSSQKGHLKNNCFDFKRMVSPSTDCTIPKCIPDFSTSMVGILQTAIRM